MVLRKAHLAGGWYPGSHEGLLKTLEECFKNKEFGPGELPTCLNKSERNIIGAVSPHAGIKYSGDCAAFSYLNLFKEKIPDTVIIIGFYHREFGPDAIFIDGEWETPIGNIPIDKDLGEIIISKTDVLVPKESVFIRTDENSIELQMPFIKYCAMNLNKETKVLPIKIMTHDFDKLNKISQVLADVINSSNKDITVVASSDMSHESIQNEKQLKEFKDRDLSIIKEFEKLNPESIIKLVGKKSICGLHTITLLILTCQRLNALKGQLMKYYASAEKYGIGGYCVGYFSGIISR
ncbi:MAG: AmmeMemoRadiSam system protein B [Promethearchaeota archaeon]